MDGFETFSIEDFNGGISALTSKGVRGSFAFGSGLNVRGNNTLTCNQKLKKDSASTVVDLPLVIFKGSDGAMYAFGDTGKIYRKASAGSWTLKHTDADGKITGACEFKSTSNSFILYATQTKLKKITLTNAGGTWSGNVVEVGTFVNGAATDYHTMRVAIGVVLVNDGDRLAMYDYADAFNNSALQMKSGVRGKSMLDRDNLVIVGAKNAALAEGYFITWDRLSDSWLKQKPAQGNSVNAMGFLEGGVMAQVGDDGALKYWNYGETYPLLVIPGTANCYPGAVTEYKTITHFGMNGGSKNGVYSYGRINKNDPLALCLEYVPSHGKLTGTEIGALGADGADLYVSWKDGSTYGIDVIDQSNKAVAIYESLKNDMGRSELDKLVKHWKVLMAAPLPASCSVALQVRSTANPAEADFPADIDADGWVTCKMTDDREAINTTGDTKGIFDAEAQGEVQEVRLVLTPSGNNAPEVRALHAYFSFDNGL